MDDTFQSQIKEYCKIVMPEGLKELMSDISREVLRAQPQDIYEFITKYLAALLVTRENLSIASHICSAIGDSACEPELEDELRHLGLSEEDVISTCAIIEEYFEEGGVNENNLMAKLITRWGIREHAQLPALFAAVRRAFVKHQVNTTVIYETPSDSDEHSRAASHTLDLYRKSKPTVGEYFQKAVTVQAAYRAYGVRRQKKKKILEEQNDKKNIRFHDKTDVCNLDDSWSGSDITTSETTKEDKDKMLINKPCLATVSSVSLAGSHLNLPTHKPYSIHGNGAQLVEIPEKEEKEHAIIDYVAEEFEMDNLNVEYDKEFNI